MPYWDIKMVKLVYCTLAIMMFLPSGFGDSKSCNSCTLQQSEIILYDETALNDKVFEIKCTDNLLTDKAKFKLDIKKDSPFFLKDNALYLSSKGSCPNAVDLKCSSTKFTLKVTCSAKSLLLTKVNADQSSSSQSSITTSSEASSDNVSSASSHSSEVTSSSEVSSDEVSSTSGQSSDVTKSSEASSDNVSSASSHSSEVTSSSEVSSDKVSFTSSDVTKSSEASSDEVSSAPSQSSDATTSSTASSSDVKLEYQSTSRTNYANTLAATLEASSSSTVRYHEDMSRTTVYPGGVSQNPVQNHLNLPTTSMKTDISTFSELQVTTTKGKSVSISDLKQHLLHLSNITDTIQSIQLTDIELRKLVQEYLITANQLVDEDSDDMWDTAKQNPVSLARRIDAFQQAVLKVGNFTSPFRYTTTNTATILRSIQVNDHQKSSIVPVSSTSVTFPPMSYLGHSVMGVGTTVYRGIILNSSSSGTLRSDVISIVTYPETPPRLRQPIELTIRFQKGTEQNLGVYYCAFLNLKTSTWSDTGCDVVSANETHISCHCYHLTNFAVLMQLTDVEISSDHHAVLNTLTAVGSAASLTAIALSLLIILWLRQFTDRLLIMVNLMVALALAQTTFLAGINTFYDTILCRFVAMILHYLYLAVFTLMLAEGVQLYQKLYRVMSDGLRIRYLLITAWTAPVMVVVVTLSVRIDDFGTDKSCWLSTRNGTIWAFVGPAIFVILVNAVVLCLVIRVYLTVKINAKKSQFAKLRSSLRAALVLLPLIGLTWVFGVLAMGSSTIVFQYIFTILNSLQGFFIFIFHVVMNGEITESFKKKTQRISNSRSWFKHSSSSDKAYFAKRNSVTPIMLSSTHSDGQMSHIMK